MRGVIDSRIAAVYSGGALREGAHDHHAVDASAAERIAFEIRGIHLPEPTSCRVTEPIERKDCPRQFYRGIIWAAGSRRRRSVGSLVTMGSRRSLAMITTDA